MTPQKNRASIPDQGQLRPNRLGVASIVFFVVAAAAPLVGMTGAVPIAIVLGNGAAAPGAYLLVGLTLLLFSVGYGAMSRRVTNSGAFFAYVGRGLGLAPGLGAACVSVLSYLAIQLALYGFMGGLLAGQWSVLPWWGWALLAWALVTGLSLRHVEVGARLLGLLMVLELLALLITAMAVLLGNNGQQGLQWAASFAPSNILAGGLSGSAGIALAFALASFIGFEATAIYGEESIDPKTAVPRATYLAVAVITIIFALTSFAIVSAIGAADIVARVAELTTVNGTPLADPAALLFKVANDHVGSWMTEAMKWLVLSSLFAGLLAFQNSAARYFFALGRGGALPKLAATVNRHGAPVAGALITSAVTLIVIVLFVGFGLDPVLNLFYWSSGIAVVGILLIEWLVSVAVMVYFHRHPNQEDRWTGTIAPALSAVLLALGIYLLTSRFGLLTGAVLEGVDPSTTAWGLNGLGWFLVSMPFIALAAGVLVSLVLGQDSDRLIQDVLT